MHKWSHRAIWVAGVAFVCLARPASSRPEPEQAVEYSVTVYRPGGGEPGVPILVRLRDREGRVVGAGRTNAAGAARLHVAASTAEAALTLEALLDLGAGRSVGVIDTLNRGCNAYEVFLPQFRALQCQGTIDKTK